VPDHSRHARLLREIADTLDTEFQPTDDALAPHPDALDAISNRHTKRGQLNYAATTPRPTSPTETSWPSHSTPGSGQRAIYPIPDPLCP